MIQIIKELQRHRFGRRAEGHSRRRAPGPIAFSVFRSSGSWSAAIAMDRSDQIRRRRAMMESLLIHLVADHPAATGTRVCRNV
jgi:hypothetical protein